MTMPPSSPPTFRPMRTTCAGGLHTCLSGKMHFVGPDQMHGFEERLTTDIYPADFGWTPDYRKPGERIDWWYHNLGSVTGAGVAEISNQMEYDDDVAFRHAQDLRSTDAGKSDRPWMLTVSFTHPHDPYVARQEILGSLRGLRAPAPGFRRSPMRTTIRIRNASSMPMTGAASTSPKTTSAARAAPISPTSPISTTRSARSWRARSHADGRRHHHRLLSPTTATCWASAACGSR
jgi:arylsulfatase A-like enzyme